MEEWTASPQEPKEFSKERVKGCDLIVLLVALRRGHVPEGETLSITQLEYEAALNEGIEPLIFMLDEDAKWEGKFNQLEKDPELRKWREKLAEHIGVGFFNHAPESIDIAAALTRWVIKKGVRKSSEKEKLSSPQTDFIRTPWLGVEVLQNDKSRPIYKIDKDYWTSRNVVRIPLLPAPFEVRFPKIGESGSVMIAAWTDASIFDQISANLERESVPYFKGGTGMADTPFGSGGLILNSEAHNHFDRDGRLKVAPNGSAKILFNTICMPDGSIGFPKSTDIFVVIYLCEYNASYIRAGSFERIILSF
jgi:hypothetical protein